MATWRVELRVYEYGPRYGGISYGRVVTIRGHYASRTLDIEAHSYDSARDKAFKGAAGRGGHTEIQYCALAPFGAIDPIIPADRPSWAGSQTWQGREMLHFAKGEYKPIPWADESWAAIPETAEHFAHVSTDDPSKLAFTVSAAKGEADKQERIKPGRYLKKFYDSILDESAIRDWAGKFAANNETLGLHFAESPDDIERVYTEGPHSCMAYESGNYESCVHPVRVYGAGDIRVAYLMRDDNITARALVYGDIHSRIYGDEVRMESALGAAGFSHGSLDGAKLMKIESGGYDSFVLPYIDDCGVDDMGGYLIVRDNGEFDADAENGLSGENENLYSCDNCGDRFDIQQEGATVNEESQWCDSCYTNHAFHCESCDISYSDDNHAHNGICDGCIGDSHFICDSCGEYFEHDEMHGTPDDETYCGSCFNDEFKITECGETIGSDDSCECEECEIYENSAECMADPRQIPLIENVESRV